MTRRICCLVVLLLFLCGARADISPQNCTLWKGAQELAGSFGPSFKLSRISSREGFDPPPYDLIILEPKGSVADSVVIYLHGLGQNAEENILLVLAMRNNGLGTTRFILPQAPTQKNDLWNMIIPSWFNMKRGPNGKPVLGSEEELKAVASNIDSIAEVQRTKFGIPANKIAVMGISQGGALALTLYLRFKVGVCIGWSTAVPAPESYPDAMTDDSATAPLLMLQGRLDIAVLQNARKTRDLIISLGRSVRYVEFPLAGHWLLTVLPQVLNLSVWQLLDVFQGP